MSNGEELVVGDVLDEKYLIEGLIGRGGMGTVYRARHVRLDSPRAIKIMRPELAQDDAFIRRFRNEALLAEGVRHPNVVALYDFSTLPDGTFYIVWEHVEGATIGQLLSRGARFTGSEVASLIEDVADGLATAHRQGILHRDVSPDNIMVCTDAQGKRTAKLLDFGVAKGGGVPAETPTDADMCFGKIGYASPEQMGLLKNEEQLDPRTDVFSLAAVTFAMLVGESPFDTSSMQAFIHDLMIAPEADVRSRFLERLPEPWREPLSRALARDRKQRTPTVGAFIAALKRAAHETSSDGVLESGPVSRRGLYASLAAVAVIAAMTFTLVSTLPPPTATSGVFFWLISLVAPIEPEAIVPPPPQVEEPPQQQSITDEIAEAGKDPPATNGDVGTQEVETHDKPTAPEPGGAPPRRPDKVAEPETDLKTPPEKQGARDQSPDAVDDPKPNVQEPSQEKGVTGEIGEGAGDPSAPYGETETLVIETPDSPTVPKPGEGPPTPEPEPKDSIGEGEEGEEETPRESVLPAPPRINKYVEPEYPARARWLGIEGDVHLKAVINEKGEVTELSVERSIDPLLDQAAMDAARQWEYEPTLVDGVAVPIELTLIVQFNLTQ
jgi:TonB family protein